MYVYYRCCCGLVAKSCRLFCYPWTSLSVGVLRQEYWSGEPFPSPGDLPNPGVKLMSPALAGEFFFTTEPPQLGHTFDTTYKIDN